MVHGQTVLTGRRGILVHETEPQAPLLRTEIQQPDQDETQGMARPFCGEQYPHSYDRTGILEFNTFSHQDLNRDRIIQHTEAEVEPPES